MFDEVLKKKIGSFFMIGFDGSEPKNETLKLLTNSHVGSVILFASNCLDISQTASLIQFLKGKNTSLCVAVDHEGGRVHRLPKPVTHFPPMSVLGTFYQRIPSTKVAREVGKVMGRELKALGFDFNFAPVLDVNTNPLNPVIGDRSFGNRAELVAVAGGHFIEGLQQMGVAACGKHFPGHGDTDTDSHEVLPRLPHNLKRLRALELVPFRMAVEKNVAAIMTAHVVYNGLDKGLPATFSVKLIRDLLREELQFQGLVVSDDLSMEAIASHWKMEEACIQAFLAGCDLLIIGKNPQAQILAIQTFMKAVEKGEIPKVRIEESFERIQKFKQKYCLPTTLTSSLKKVIGTKEHQELLKKVKDLAR